MTHRITAEHLADAAAKAVTKELFGEFNHALQSFCDEEHDRIVIFRTLRYTRIRLCVLRKYLHDKDAATRNTQGRFLDIAIGYINTELELLTRYSNRPPTTLFRWTGTIVELVKLIYGLQELHCIDNGEVQINSLIEFFNSLSLRIAIAITPMRR